MPNTRYIRNTEDLAAIVLESAYTARGLLGEEPWVALLSFSPHGGTRYRVIDKIIEALTIARERTPELAVDGALQVYAALVKEIAERKTAVTIVISANNYVVSICIPSISLEAMARYSRCYLRSIYWEDDERCRNVLA